MSLHFTSLKHQIDLIKLPLILKQINFLSTCTCISVPSLVHLYHTQGKDILY